LLSQTGARLLVAGTTVPVPSSGRLPQAAVGFPVNLSTLLRSGWRAAIVVDDAIGGGGAATISSAGVRATTAISAWIQLFGPISASTRMISGLAAAFCPGDRKI